MSRKPPAKSAPPQPQQVPPAAIVPQEKKVSQAKKAIQEAAKYDIGKTTDDYEASKVAKKDYRMCEEEKKAVEDLNRWGGGGDDIDDDDDFWIWPREICWCSGILPLEEANGSPHL